MSTVQRLRHLLVMLFVLLGILQPQSASLQNNKAIPILIRCDDWGMSHSVNRAAKQVLDLGIPVSASVMFACPWYTEAVELLKKAPHASVGIHLTLNAEWKQLRWGPVAGASVVPTLVDSNGFFFPSRSALYGNNPKLSEIETELRAQIERALRSDLRIDYLDYHMGAAVQTAETRAIVEKLAAEYHLAVSRYFDEVDVDGGYAAPVGSKLDTLLAKLSELRPGGTKLFVMHVGMDDPELSALEDLNVFGPKGMSKHRQAELDALLSPRFQQALKQSRFRLVNYRMLIDEKGLASMKRPAQQ